MSHLAGIRDSSIQGFLHAWLKVLLVYLEHKVRDNSVEDGVLVREAGLSGGDLLEVPHSLGNYLDI